MSTAPLPQQREHPGEGHGKRNPQRDARSPMFPNQEDPPSERPWPATSDEGNTVPAPAQQQERASRMDEIEEPTAGGGQVNADTTASDLQRPWTVLVDTGKVVARYRADDTHVVSRGVTRINLGEATIDVYEVDARNGEPPEVGEPVDPTALGWVRAG